jgi:hypothetical protein
MIIALALWISSALSFQRGDAPSDGAMVSILETPRPVAYVVSTQTICGDVDFRVGIGTGPQGSQIVEARANSGDAVFRAGNDETLASLIRETKVIGLHPSACFAHARSIELAVRVYDEKRDAIPGQSGVITFIVTATAPK